MAARKAPSKKKAARKRTRSLKARRRKPGPGTKGGRPEVVINRETLRDTLIMGVSFENVAHLMGIAESTLHKHLRDEPELRAIADKAIAERNQSLLACMWENAQGGNASVQIFLSQQWLGMANRKAVEVSGPGGGAIPVDDQARGKMEERIVALISARERRAATRSRR